MIDLHGYDAGKKIKGKKRHLLVDTQGLMLQAIVHAADIQDREGGAVLSRVNVEIVKRSERRTFVVLPKRWIVERTIGWLNRCRRLAKDWET